MIKLAQAKYQNIYTPASRTLRPSSGMKRELNLIETVVVLKERKQGKRNRVPKVTRDLILFPHRGDGERKKKHATSEEKDSRKKKWKYKAQFSPMWFARALWCRAD